MAKTKTENALILAKVPPHTSEVERTVLGSMLIDVNALDTAMEVLTEDCFYSTAHRKIYNCIKDLYMHDSGSGVDIVTIAEQLRKKKWLESAGSEVYLSELVESVATSANIGAHLKILEEKSNLRALISAAAEISTECFNPDADAKHVVDRAEKKIFQIAEAGMKNKPEKLRELLSGTFKDIEKYAESGGISGVRTGFTELDELTTGFHAGDLIIIAARPSMGKTALCLTMALNAAIRSDDHTPIAIFSLEMSKAQLVQRMLCSEAETDMHRLRGGRLNKEERGRLSYFAGPLYDAPVFIDDTPAINPMELRAKCRRLKAREDIGMIMVDYLQLMSVVDRAENRQQEISQISRSLKGIAKELDVPVVALSQLSRAVEQRSGSHRPQLSDLRESGAIEQDADLVLFIYREYLYDKENEDNKNVAEIIIGKQRNGPIGIIKLSFIDEFASFKNLDKSHSKEKDMF